MVLKFYFFFVDFIFEGHFFYGVEMHQIDVERER
jgi:hypothetical protein